MGIILDSCSSILIMYYFHIIEISCFINLTLYMYTIFYLDLILYCFLFFKVGLITRNIRIEGADEPAGSLQDQSFGCRVLVSKYTRDGIVYKGRARFSEVQFSNCGQLGYTEKYDPR